MDEIVLSKSSFCTEYCRPLLPCNCGAVHSFFIRGISYEQVKNKVRLAFPKKIRTGQEQGQGQDIRTTWDVYVILVPQFFALLLQFLVL